MEGGQARSRYRASDFLSECGPAMIRKSPTVDFAAYLAKDIMTAFMS